MSVRQRAKRRLKWVLRKARRRLQAADSVAASPRDERPEESPMPEEDFGDLSPEPWAVLADDGLDDEDDEEALRKWAESLEDELREFTGPAEPEPEPSATLEPVLDTPPDREVTPVEDRVPPTDEERERVLVGAVEAARTVYDPEIPVDIYELGLIYDIVLQPDWQLDVTMTLTSPNCPAAQSLPSEVETSMGQVDGVSNVNIDLVFEPPWDPSRMSEAARLELNL